MSHYVNGKFWQKDRPELRPIPHTFHGYIGSEERDRSRDGYMKDEQGDSDVTEWNLGENVLTFKKKYSHMNHAVSYRLEKITPTVYFGKWEYGDAGIVVAEGEARLILTAIPEGFTELATLFDEVR